MKLKISFNENNSIIPINFIQTGCTFNTNFGEVFLVKTDEVYEEGYNVIPRVYQQTLATKDKLLLDDITVEVIPLAKTINLSSGYTVTIG